jgi:predicted DNA-binding transcriptional regulator AlpA
MPESKFYTDAELLTLLPGYTRRRFVALAREGRFPSPTRPGGPKSATLWSRDAVNQWIASAVGA